jgi:hypothetical protein
MGNISCEGQVSNNILNITKKYIIGTRGKQMKAELRSKAAKEPGTTRWGRVVKNYGIGFV